MKTESNEILDEVYRVRREIFDECGGTLHGLFLRFSGKDQGLKRREATPRKRKVPAVRKGAEFADATMVREGEAPKYGEGTSDLARKGEKGE
jgi:hypothetical protein